MKHTMLIAVLSVVGVFSWAHDHDAMKAGPAATDGQAKTIEGKVVDLACYLGHGEMSDKHGKCAKACVLGGSPAGVLGADGSLFLLVEDHDNPKPYSAVKKMAGEAAK